MVTKESMFPHKMPSDWIPKSDISCKEKYFMHQLHLCLLIFAHAGSLNDSICVTFQWNFPTTIVFIFCLNIYLCPDWSFFYLVSFVFIKIKRW